MAIEAEELISSTESCRVLDVSRSRLTRWAADGTLPPAHKLPGKNGAFLFNRADVERLRDQRAAERADQASA